MTQTIPESCNACHDRHVCGASYGSLNCHYKDAIESRVAGGKQVIPKKDEAPAPDVVREPSHYKHGRFEVIDEMLLAFGPQRTYDFCILNAWKYRARAPYKGNAQQDMEKADRYLEMAREIAKANKEVMNYGQAPIGLIKE